MNALAKPTSALCPSSPAKDGALLYGIVVGSGLAYLKTAVPVTAEDLKDVGERVEDRFRFSLPCLHKGCHNFEHNHCALIGRLLDKQSAAPAILPQTLSGSVNDLPECAIRDHCQWFGTEGSAACGVCPTVSRPKHSR